MRSLLILITSILFSFGITDDFSERLSDQTNDVILILNKSENTAWQLNAETGHKIAEYQTGDAPHEVAVSPDQSRAIITNYGNESPGNTLTIIDLKSQQVSKTITLGEFQRPHGVEWFSDGERAIVTAEEQQTVILVNIDSGEILSSIKTNQDVSHMVTVGPEEHTAYVTNLGSGSLSILDLSSEKNIQTIQTGAGTEGVTTLPNRNEVWITNRSANTVSILDTNSNEIIKTMESSSFPIRAETSPDQRWVAVSNAQSSEVSVFDTESRQLIQKITTVKSDENGMPIGLTFSADGSRLLVANSDLDRIAVIDTDSWQLIRTFETGDTPDGIAFISK